VTTIEWSQAWELGVGAMDDTHREFVAAVNALGDAPDDALQARLDELIAHARRHFAAENDWMAKLPFPPIHCHMAEHQGVLEAMGLARTYMAEGKLEVGRVLGQELAAWFANHARTMDAMLAAVIKLTGFDPADPRPVAIPPELAASVACDGEHPSRCSGLSCG
jgi:hemerythrin-like metal-binding protein